MASVIMEIMTAVLDLSDNGHQIGSVVLMGRIVQNAALFFLSNLIAVV